MRTYYRSHDALVTDECFVWRTSPPKTFRIRELHDVGLVRGDLDPLRPASAHVAGGALVLVAVSWPMLDTPAAYVVAFVGLAIPATVTAACWRMRPRCWELRATYRDQVVVLYASADPVAFGKVTRSLRRALEAAGPPSSGYSLAPS
jgi:hypothetical protein